VSELRRLFRGGEPYVWFTGAALALSLLMVAALVTVICANALGFFWPRGIVRVTLADGRVLAGQIVDRERVPDGDERSRIKLKVANRDLMPADFVWIEEREIVTRDRPADLVVIERAEWGDLTGAVSAVRDGETTIASGAHALRALERQLPAARALRRQIRKLETGPIGAINDEQERIRLGLRRLERAGITSGPQVEALQRQQVDLQTRYAAEEAKLARLRAGATTTVVVRTADGQDTVLPLAQVIAVYRPNAMGVGAKAVHYVSKLWEFVSDDPRESNTEGGVFPAIFGTVLMVLIMSIIVTPLGVLAAFYLREYARPGTFVSTVRIAVNNLAGVPSIVFGVFGVGFFIYGAGGTIDRWFFADALPTPTFGTGGILWASLTLALLTIPVVIVATEEGLAAIPRSTREASLALGATKLETTVRVVLPAVTPSILTGLILAMARAAGEVAPLMLTGVVKLAPALPFDATWPFLHLERKFMHLGFHIYDVGFQSPNVDAARPMVFMTTLLLLVIVVLLNLTAIRLRRRLRRRYQAVAL
jgi:phosphate transport system permease protein